MDHRQLANQSWPKEGLERVERCPICGEEDRTLLHDGLTDKVFFCAPGRWTLYQCRACGAAYLDPRPTPETIAMAYSKYYTHLEEDDIPKGTLAHIKRRLRNDYLNARYNVDLQPAWKIGRWLVPLLDRKKKQIEESVRHLPTTPGILVDIGCGNGHYLRTAMQLGWEAWGVDLDPKAVETARKTGATVIQGGFPDTGLPSAYFDVVTLSHVIEHVHNPIAAMQEVFRILKPGGHLWLATPNLDSSGHKRFGSDWRGLEPPRHLVLFTRKSLKKVLFDTGFTSIESKRCRPQAYEFYKNSFNIFISRRLNNNENVALPLPLRLEARRADFIAKFISTGCENLVITAMRPKPYEKTKGYLL